MKTESIKFSSLRFQLMRNKQTLNLKNHTILLPTNQPPFFLWWQQRFKKFQSWHTFCRPPVKRDNSPSPRNLSLPPSEWKEYRIARNKPGTNLYYFNPSKRTLFLLKLSVGYLVIQCTFSEKHKAPVVKVENKSQKDQPTPHPHPLFRGGTTCWFTLSLPAPISFSLCPVPSKASVRRNRVPPQRQEQKGCYRSHCHEKMRKAVLEAEVAAAVFRCFLVQRILALGSAYEVWEARPFNLWISPRVCASAKTELELEALEILELEVSTFLYPPLLSLLSNVAQSASQL